MPGSKTIVKHFNSFRGKDARSSDLVRDPESAIDLHNAKFTRDGNLVNREGGKILSPNQASIGLYRHAYSNLTTGAVQEEFLTIGTALLKRINNIFQVVYTGSTTPCTMTIRLDVATGTYKLKLTEGSTVRANIDIGNGLAGGMTLGALGSQIGIVTAFLFTAGVVSGDPNTTAALVLPLMLDGDLASAPRTINLTWYSWEAVNTTVSNQFGAYYGARGNEDFEHASIVNASNNLYVATGYEFLHKYDGQTVYRAGMPQPVAPTMALGGAGNPNGTYRYIATHIQVDNRTNRIEGTESVFSATISPANQQVNVTVPNLVAGSGYNTNSTLVNGNQVGVNVINVAAASHTLKVSDTAYFLDRSSGAYVQRTITAIGASTITVSGAVVNANNNDIISNNLRTGIYRTKAGGVDYYLVAEIPNNSFAATQVFTDNLADASIVEQYQFSLDGRDHDLLTVKPRYLCLHQGQLVAAGDFANPDTGYLSLPNEPEYFPADASSFDIVNTQLGGISGLASDGTSLVVGKLYSLFIGSGDFSEPGAYRFEKLNEGAIGFACHNSIADIGEGILFLSDSGFYLLRGGAQLIEIGEGTNPDFFKQTFSTAQTFRKKRSFGLYFEQDNSYLCYVPCETGTGTGRQVNSNSNTFVLDTQKRAWIDWPGLNMGNGLAIFENELHWMSKRPDTTGAVISNLWRRHSTGFADDYADHNVAIRFRFVPQWEDMGEPSQLKLVPRMRLYNLLKDAIAAVYTMTVQTEIDLTPGFLHSSFTITFGGTSSSGWGNFAWGTAPWGTPMVQSSVVKLRVGKLKSIRFLFTHATLHEKVGLTGWEYEVVKAYEKEMKS